MCVGDGWTICTMMEMIKIDEITKFIYIGTFIFFQYIFYGWIFVFFKLCYQWVTHLCMCFSDRKRLKTIQYKYTLYPSNWPIEMYATIEHGQLKWEKMWCCQISPDRNEMVNLKIHNLHTHTHQNNISMYTIHEHNINVHLYAFTKLFCAIRRARIHNTQTTTVDGRHAFAPNAKTIHIHLVWPFSLHPPRLPRLRHHIGVHKAIQMNAITQERWKERGKEMDWRWEKSTDMTTELKWKRDSNNNNKN